MTTLAIAEDLSELPPEAAFEPDENVIKLRPLTFVNSHCVRGIMFGQPVGHYSTYFSVTMFKKNT